MILDEEVFAVILAMTIVGSAIGVALAIPRMDEPFTALGLLNEEGKIGEYPSTVFVGQEVKLNLFIYNHLGYTALFKYQVKEGDGEIPNEKSPLTGKKVLNEGFIILPHKENKTIPLTIVFRNPKLNQTLVCELYYYNPDSGLWEYTGRYVFLRLNVTEVILP
ncbi:MAG: DUF1616 domain-containing protein [Thermosphaera sp.]